MSILKWSRWVFSNIYSIASSLFGNSTFGSSNFGD